MTSFWHWGKKLVPYSSLLPSKFLYSVFPVHEEGLCDAHRCRCVLQIVQVVAAQLAYGDLFLFISGVIRCLFYTWVPTFLVSNIISFYRKFVSCLFREAMCEINFLSAEILIIVIAVSFLFLLTLQWLLCWCLIKCFFSQLWRHNPVVLTACVVLRKSDLSLYALSS